MTQRLKQSTASQILHIGPLITTAGAAATGLTIANTDVKLLKEGGTAFVNKNSGGLTEIGQGMYYGTFDATDSNTIGDMQVCINVAGAMPFKQPVHVLGANHFEAQVTNTEYLEVHGAGGPFSIAAGTLTAKKRDGTTTQFTRSVTGTAGADPITSST